MKNLLIFILTSGLLSACNSGGNTDINTTSGADYAAQTMSMDASAMNVAILNNPSLQDVRDIGLYELNITGKPFFNNVVLFAANINGRNPNSPELYYNAQMNELLNTSAGVQVIRGLQSKGIKVQIAYLGNHQNAGWSCTMTAATTTNLAASMVTAVNKYGLDGIMIDDEYSTCSGNVNSFFNLVKTIKMSPEFSGKILTKALFEDEDYFIGVTTNVAQYLDYGYEMTYAGELSDLSPYVGYGMPKISLGFGLWSQNNPLGKVFGITQAVMNEGYAGVMIWAPNTSFDTTMTASAYYTNIAQAEYGSSASVSFVNSR